MANENDKPEGQAPEQKSRREFVKTSAQVAVTAPAVAMLLSGVSTTASATVSSYQASASHILDDYTFGNDHEDIDALKSQSNTNPNNHTPEQDDVYHPIT